MFRFSIQQELLAGFGFRAQSALSSDRAQQQEDFDIAFKDQVIATVNADSKHLLGPRQRLRADTGQRAILCLRSTDARECPETAATGEHS